MDLPGIEAAYSAPELGISFKGQHSATWENMTRNEDVLTAVSTTTEDTNRSESVGTDGEQADFNRRRQCRTGQPARDTEVMYAYQEEPYLKVVLHRQLIHMQISRSGARTTCGSQVFQSRISKRFRNSKLATSRISF
ncbi:hypothetical protein MBRA_49690 [Mycobacterium branderi]|uniref:Uncharacterized protein n=1 Tax=Mycobacterium branderi TaxID=43348 RepID=A0ABM7KU59_9MYCO|nr:hypothetical protein MBRA_49690 [Mycobacterium branderi]